MENAPSNDYIFYVETVPLETVAILNIYIRVLPWIATSALFVGFHTGPAYLPRQMPGTHIMAISAE